MKSMKETKKITKQRNTRLPIGIQTFSKIIEGKYLYVDKTSHISRMIEGGETYFLSRPRRFGKTLYLDTLRSLFEGRKELFEGLYIYDKWNWEVTYPVIHFNFADGILKTEQDFTDKLEELMKENSRRLGVTCEYAMTDRRCFKDLIIKVNEKYGQKVVILIDEYDKPMLDNVTDSAVARLMRDNLRDLYSVIKGADSYLRFVFLTGVSKFSKVSIFSGLNTLEDISLDADYSTICGYTQHDLESDFAGHLRGVDMELLRKWYNGYNFLGDKVYNPFDILLFISKKHNYLNYWFSTGTPTFLIDLIKTQKYYLPNLEIQEVSESVMDSFDIDQLNIIAILFQSGYLTIQSVVKKYGKTRYKLGYPNLEVRTAMSEHLITYLTQDSTHIVRNEDILMDALYGGDLSLLEQGITALFASIPYDNYTKSSLQDYEGYYSSVIYVYFSALGCDALIAEDHTNKGRIDLTLMVDEKIYIFEFKVVDEDTGNNTALQQIKERRYAEKYQGQGDIYLVGIEFSKKERNVTGFEWERG